MVAHGSQKLFGWFNGYGVRGTGASFASIGYPAGNLMAVLAGIVEAGGGVALAAGFLTPLVSFAFAPPADVEPRGEIEMPEDLAEALRGNPQASAIWNDLPVAHRRGHVIAIQRITDVEARAERIEHIIEHLFEKHAS